jgi:chaperonin GroES
MADSLSISQIKPLAGYVLVKPAEPEKKTASGIYLPDTHEEKPQYGKVLAVGGPIMDDGAEIKAPVKAGDTVIYKKWGGNDFKLDDVEYQFLKFEDVLAVIGK